MYRCQPIHPAAGKFVLVDDEGESCSTLNKTAHVKDAGAFAAVLTPGAFRNATGDLTLFIMGMPTSDDFRNLKGVIEILAEKGASFHILPSLLYSTLIVIDHMHL
jgi:hypothetical protein